MSTALIKASLLFQYLRIFDRGNTRMLCIIVLVITCLWGMAYSLLAWFPCKPIYGYWDWSKSEQCWAFASLDPNEFFATYASHAVINMVLDFVVLAIPMPLYFRKTTSWPTRRRLLMLLCAGTLYVLAPTCVMSTNFSITGQCERHLYLAPGRLY